MVDGGVRNVSPLGDVLDSDPDEVVVINCSPQASPALNRPLGNALDVGIHALDLALNEIFVTDLEGVPTHQSKCEGSPGTGSCLNQG